MQEDFCVLLLKWVPINDWSDMEKDSWASVSENWKACLKHGINCYEVGENR